MPKNQPKEETGTGEEMQNPLEPCKQAVEEIKKEIQEMIKREATQLTTLNNLQAEL